MRRAQSETEHRRAGLLAPLWPLRAWNLALVLGLAVAAGVPETTPAPAAGEAEGAKSGTCWNVGYQFEDCCAPAFGPAGNVDCWDEVYTYEVCCGGGDPAEAGCESPYFERFRRLVVEYYSSGAASTRLSEFYPKLTLNFEERARLCAPAALQAALLQLEERVALEPATVTGDRIAGHALRLQQVIETGLLKPEEARRWPLERGLQRVRTEANRKARRLARPRQPNVALVLSYCRERLDWINSTLSQSAIRGAHLVVVQKCPGVDASSAVPHRRKWRSVSYVDVEDMSLRADECSAYLGYLAQEYYQLPDYMVFVHADAPEHIGSIDRPNILDDSLHAALNGVDVPFAHLGGNRITMAWKTHAMTPLWRGIFGSSFAPEPSAVRTYCCSHFLVARERVQLRPQSFFQQALEFITSTRSYSYLPTSRPWASRREVDGRLVCQNMMFLWHIIFGEGLDQPHRMFDAELPLFLKLRNVRTAYMNL